jgi:hypothetical protein
LRRGRRGERGGLECFERLERRSAGRREESEKGGEKAF